MIKRKLYTVPVLALLEFNIAFEVESDTSMTRIGSLLTQDRGPMEYFSEKLSEALQKWTTYEQELYAIVRAQQQWEHYGYVWNIYLGSLFVFASWLKCT